MSANEIAVKVENLSKIYRIGLKEHMNDSFGSALLHFLRSPLKNYRRYRSLYNFDDIMSNPGSGSRSDASDVIWALKDVSFELKRGEALGVIGRNGAGKSSLLKILSRVTDPTSGRAEIRGRVSSLLEVGTGFHPELTGRENVYLNGAVLGMRKTEIDRKFDEIVAFSGVEKFMETPVKRYSSGMKVRLAFSVAAHLEPEILIVDEVLAVGDADFQKKCLNKMETVGQQGRTVVFVSHNMPAVARLCTTAILLDQGRIAAEGQVNQVINAYLHTEQGVVSERTWESPENAPGGKVARLHGVRARTDDGGIGDPVDVRQAITLEMEYEVLEEGYELLPHFIIRNEEGAFVFTSLENDPKWRGLHRPRGYYTSSVKIPGNFLAEGMHYVNCALITFRPNITQFAEKQVIAFRVLDYLEGDSARGDWAGELVGVVRPLLTWSTQFSPRREGK